MKTRIFLADTMAHTFFSQDVSSHETLLVKNELVDNAADAHIIVARTYDALLPHVNRKQPLVVWTHEPILNVCSEGKFWSYAGKRYVNVINLYTDDAYLSPYQYFWFKALNKNNILASAARRTKFVASLGRYGIKGERYINGVNVDLTTLRESVSLELYKIGICDIYGRGWPSFVKIVEDSRGLGWRSKKEHILNNYIFNFCLENTQWNYYVTEKLWDAIFAGCIPIYYSLNNGLRGIITDGAVIELEKLENLQDLITIIQTMTKEQRRERVSTLVDDWNRIVATVDPRVVKDAPVHRFNERIEKLLALPTSEQS